MSPKGPIQKYRANLHQFVRYFSFYCFLSLEEKILLSFLYDFLFSQILYYLRLGRLKLSHSLC